MRKVIGNRGVHQIECVNPKKDKWCVRFDIRDDKGNDTAEYFEEVFQGKPTPEKIENTLFENDLDVPQNELSEIGAKLGYNGGEFEKRFEDERNTRLVSNPYMQLMEVVREQHLAETNIPDAVALRVPATFFPFSELCKRGKQVEKGVVFKYGDKVWRVIQTHTPMDIYPPSIDTASLYTIIEPGHAGTYDDPIPYEQGMAFEKDKYYIQYGAIYLCILTTINGYPNDLKDLPTIVQPVLKSVV